MKQIIFFALAAIVLLGCEKEDVGGNNVNPTGSDAITITFNTPNENESFDFNEVVSVTGWVSKASQVHGYTLELINQSNQDSVLYSHDVHDHGAQIEMNDTWTNNLSDTSNVLIRVTAFGDHEGNTSEIAERSITCNGQ